MNKEKNLIVMIKFFCVYKKHILRTVFLVTLNNVSAT